MAKPVIPTIFVTATDTGVGKTAFSASLAALLRSQGRNVGVMKPFASGCEERDGRLFSADATCLARAAGCTDEHELICPVRLRRPLAPAAAAEIERVNINMDEVWAAMAELSRRHDCLIVEGIGGIMVPIRGDYFVAEFAAELGAPVVVVARAILGTINHTLLTVECAQWHGLEVAAVVLNRPDEANTEADATNPNWVRRLTNLPVIGPLDFYGGEMSVENCELSKLPEALSRAEGVDGLIRRYLT